MVPEIESWWDAAEAGAKTEKQLTYIKHNRHSWTYLMQCVTYNSLFVNGTEEERAAYVARNEALMDAIEKEDIDFSEGDGVRYYNPEKSPETWS